MSNPTRAGDTAATLLRQHGRMNFLVDTPRRRFLRTAGASALALHAIGSAAARRSTVEVTEGPFFVDERLDRSDIRVDPADGSVQAGLPLRLALSVSALDGATGATRPLEGVMVDLWQCDRLGRYSDVDDRYGRKFLRGYQLSDAEGRVAFQTIFPGWYEGRAPHIHCKVRRLPGGASTASLTTQFFFDEALARRIYTDPSLPYRAHGLPDQPLAADMVYAGRDDCAPGRAAGDSLKLDVERFADHAQARFEILVDLAARCRSDDGGPPPGPPPGRRGPTPWTT